MLSRGDVLIFAIHADVQERPSQQLHSPLPFPTTLPLLSARVASCQTYIADPLSYLRRVTRDIHSTICDLYKAPSVDSNLGQVRIVHSSRTLKDRVDHYARNTTQSTKLELYGRTMKITARPTE